jgi:hypothetical protein
MFRIHGFILPKSSHLRNKGIALNHQFEDFGGSLESNKGGLEIREKFNRLREVHHPRRSIVEMRFLALVAATFAILYGALDLSLDFRGANWYIRPFHAAGVLFTAISAVGVVGVSGRWIGDRPILLTLAHLVFIISIWSFVLPLGDSAAERIERKQKSKQEVGDTGYGWYYWDDSGMGNWPMTLGRLAWANTTIPVWPICLLVFSYSFFRANRPHKSPRKIR